MDNLDPQLKDDLSEDPQIHAGDPAAGDDLSGRHAIAQNDVKVHEDIDQGEHRAFNPSLQFASGNDLPAVEYEHEQKGAADYRQADVQSTMYDSWPSHQDIMDTDETGNITIPVKNDSTGEEAQEQQPQEQRQPQQETGQTQQQEHAGQPQQVQAQQQYAPPDQTMPYQNPEHGQYHAHAHAHGHYPQHIGTPYERLTPGASYGTYEGSKPKRKRASPQQLTLLNNIFEMTYFPSSDLRLAIGKELDMIPRSVQIWFQNRRSLWRSKAQQILAENKARKDQLIAQGMTEKDAEAKVTADRTEAAERQIQDQRASDAVEYAINGPNGSLAYALHGANQNVAAGAVDDGSVTRDDEAGAWAVLAAFHQARTGVLVHHGHNVAYHEQHPQHMQHQQLQGPGVQQRGMPIQYPQGHQEQSGQMQPQAQPQPQYQEQQQHEHFQQQQQQQAQTQVGEPEAQPAQAYQPQSPVNQPGVPEAATNGQDESNEAERQATLASSKEIADVEASEGVEQPDEEQVPSESKVAEQAV